MDAKKVELTDIDDGSLVVLSLGNAQHFGIKSKVDGSAYVTVLSPTVDGSPGPVTLPCIDHYKFVDFGVNWVLDFEPESLVMDHGGYPASGSLLITEDGPAILCNVVGVGLRFLFSNGTLMAGRRTLPYFLEWSVLLPSCSVEFKKVFSWPIQSDK